MAIPIIIVVIIINDFGQVILIDINKHFDKIIDNFDKVILVDIIKHFDQVILDKIVILVDSMLFLKLHTALVRLHKYLSYFADHFEAYALVA